MPLSRLIIPLLALLLAPTLHAFTVIRDANREPVESIVLFEKGKPADHLAFFQEGKAGFTVSADGALHLRLDNNDPVLAGVRWAGGPGLSASFLVSDYQYLLVTCRLEGASRNTLSNGQVQSRRPNNLSVLVTIFDEAGNRIGQANPSEVAPEGKTPEQTVTLRLPMMLLTYWSAKPVPPVHAFGFRWSAARPPGVRDYLLVIERVALAN